MSAMTAATFPGAALFSGERMRPRTPHPLPQAARRIVVELGVCSYTFRVWTAEEWEATPRAERPGDAYLMEDGESYCLIVMNSVSRVPSFPIA